MDLLKILNVADSASFAEVVSVFKSQYVENFEIQELLTQIGLEFLSEHGNQVEVFVDLPNGGYYLARRRSANSTSNEPKKSECSCFDCECCEYCELDTESGFKLILDAVASAIAGLLIDRQPEFASMQEKYDKS